MTRDDTPAKTLTTIPDWEDAEYRELSGGLTNRTWLLNCDGRQAVLKIDDEKRATPYNERLHERHIQNKAADLGLANRVLYATETVYLTEYIEGDVWREADLNNDNNLVALADALKRVHAMQLTGRHFEGHEAAQIYMKQLNGADSEMARQCLETIRETSAPRNLCCCHNDVVAENIIAADGIRLLDWEYACDNDPFFDLATVVSHHGLSDVQADCLLQAYFDGDGARWRAKLQEQQRLYEALYWLWSAARP